MTYPALLDEPLFFIIVLVVWYCGIYLVFCCPSAFDDEDEEVDEV